MTEINKETAMIIRAGLELLNRFGDVDDDVPIDLKLLTLGNYYSAEDWLLVLMRVLFVNSSKKIAQYMLDDISDIERVLEISDNCYDWHYGNFLYEYGYTGCDEDEEDSAEYIENYCEYFTSLDINVLKIYSPMVCEFDSLNNHSFVNKIPYLVGSYYGISRRDLLNCIVEKDTDNPDMNVVSIYYFNDDYGNLYENIETDDIYDEFLYAIGMYVNRMNRKGKDK